MPSQDSLATIFPSIPKTVWQAGDPDIEWLVGEVRDGRWHVDTDAFLVVRGPHIHLDMGLYGVEFQLSLAGNQPTEQIAVATAQVTAYNGRRILAEATLPSDQLTGEFSGMYQGARLDVVVEQPVEDVEFRIIGGGGCPFAVRGIKLIPRPGRVWFPADLRFDPASWEFTSDRSACAISPTVLSGPGISLPSGDYRLGFKLKPPSDITTGPVAALDVIGVPVGIPGESPVEIPVSRQVVMAEQLLAHGGIPDAKLRFRLERAYHSLEFRAEALAPGLTVQWVRLATAEEATWHHYYHLGGSASALGRPVSAFCPAGPSASGRRGSVRRFECGAICWTIEHGPCEVIGPVAERYKALGGPEGSLGYPVSRPQSVDKASDPPAMEQAFEGGKIVWSKDRDQETVEVSIAATEEIRDH